MLSRERRWCSRKKACSSLLLLPSLPSDDKRVPPEARLVSLEGTKAAVAALPKPVLSTAPSEAARAVRCASARDCPTPTAPAKEPHVLDSSALKERERDVTAGLGDLSTPLPIWLDDGKEGSDDWESAEGVDCSDVLAIGTGGGRLLAGTVLGDTWSSTESALLSAASCSWLASSERGEGIDSASGGVLCCCGSAPFSASFDMTATYAYVCGCVCWL